MNRRYTTDAHFAQYISPKGRRLCRESIDHTPVTLEVIVFDVDCPATHGTSEPTPDSWRHDLRRKMMSLCDAHYNPYYYETRGGARIIYAQPEPTVIRSHDDARTWSQDYAIQAAYLARAFGIVADPACADWPRLFRSPHATREPGGSPEDLLVVGDPNAIGVLAIEPTSEDLACAMAASKAFVSRRVLDFEPCASDGYGVLYHALRARGNLIREHGTAYVIRCPREPQHTCGRTGDGSTLLYPPSSGEQVGAIHCLHGHCSNMTVRDWLREFSRQELDAARDAAGIRRAA